MGEDEMKKEEYTLEKFKQEYECNFLPERYPEWNSNTSYAGREKVMYNGKVCYHSSQIGVEPTEIGH